MRYMLEVKIDGYTSLITDCNGNEDPNRLWDFYERLCDAEQENAEKDVFDAILEYHGCSYDGAGIMYNVKRQGYEIQMREDRSKYIVINGIEFEILNNNYTPDITTSFAPAGFWTP